LAYFDRERPVKCAICGKERGTTVSCGEGHFVCDACHSRAGYEEITERALRSDSGNPIAIAGEMMESAFVNMHGPEHHYLVVAALLSAYGNSGGQVDLEPALRKAGERAAKVPGGI
jgi:hypothetical protein